MRRAIPRITMPARVPSMLALVATFFAFVATPPASASAHLGSNKGVAIGVDGHTVVARLTLDPIDIAMGLGLGERAPIEEVMRHRDGIRRWVARGISVRGSEPCRGAAFEGPRRTDDDRILVALRFRCAGPPRALVDGLVFPDDPQHEAYISLTRDDEETRTVLRAGAQEVALASPRGPLGTFGDYFGIGVHHFATGYDHILFLLSLLLPFGLVARDEGARPVLRSLALLATAFTLGHSITLALASLGIVRLPSAPIEIGIALSIVLVAIHDAIRLEAGRGWIGMALGFGLLHGFGFAGALGEAGLPEEGSALALLGFNLGLEAAQLVVIVIVAPGLVWAGRRPRYRTVARAIAASIALVGAYWAVTRAFASV